MKRQKSGRSKHPLFDYISTKLDLSGDFAGAECMVEVRGQSDVTVRGCRRILVYTKEEIRLAMPKYDLSIRGAHLDCTAYFSRAVRIDGQVEQIEFLTRERSVT